MKEYYKPGKLVIGLFLFAISLIVLGMCMTTNVKDGVQDEKDTIYAYTFVLAVIGMIVGQGFILDAASYDVKNAKGEQK